MHSDHYFVADHLIQILFPKKVRSERLLLVMAFLVGSPLHAQIVSEISPQPVTIQSTPQQATQPEIRRAIPLTGSNSGVIVQSPSSKDENSERLPQIIRMAPMVPHNEAERFDAQLAVANGFYMRQQLEMAVSEYKNFIEMTSPGQPHRAEAFFRCGEALRTLGKSFDAQDFYKKLLQEISSGEFAAAASYRLGEYYQSRKEFRPAVESYERARKLSVDPKVQNATLYQEALCRDELGEEQKAMILFDEVSQIKENNSNWIQAKMALAALEEKNGNKEKAIATYQTIIQETQGILAAEAMVKAAMISGALGKKEQAMQFFEKAIDLPLGGVWKNMAALGMMKLAYEAKDYKKALIFLDLAAVSSADANPEMRPQALLVAANALRQLGDFQKALSQYNQLIKESPRSHAAQEAAFPRLLTLQALKDPTLSSQIEEYLLLATDLHERAQVRLLKAENFFSKGDAIHAAETYESLLNDVKSTASILSPERSADILYKEAWCWNRAGNSQKALDAFSQYIITYPKGTQSPAILIQRGLLFQKMGNLPGALTDYTAIIEQYPQASERECALQQKALALGQQQNNKGMVETFQQLLRYYPTTKAAAQANFWIGWAAFEAKDYKGAIVPLEQARKLNPKEFGEKAGVRLLLCRYYLEQLPETMREVAALKSEAVPGEVLRWLGLKAYQQGDFLHAERFLNTIVKSGKIDLLTAEVEAALAQALINQGKFKEAEVSATKALELSTDPESRAQATLTLARLQKGLTNYNEAEKLVNEALLLQPEGNLNSEARLFLGDLLATRTDYDAAARAYMTVALLTNDPKITPKALKKAIDAYRRAHNITEAQKAEEELKQRFPEKTSKE